MSTGKHTALSHFRRFLKNLPEAHYGLALDCLDQIQRILRGSLEERKAQAQEPIRRLRDAMAGLPEGKLAPCSALLEEVLAEAMVQTQDESHQAKEAIRAKHAAKVKELTRQHAQELRTVREEVQTAAAEEIEALRYALKCLTGPGHVPPADAVVVESRAARPPIQVSHWKDGPWSCLRLEERTVGHHREKAFIRPDTKLPGLRFDPETEKWMRWVRGIARELELLPTSGQVREVFYPGLVYTFLAWMELHTLRPLNLLHPMDPDNVVKPTMDALQTKPYKGEESPFGAYQNDTQVVDLLVYRLPQSGHPSVDRLALGKEARKNRKARRNLLPQ